MGNNAQRLTQGRRIDTVAGAWSDKGDATKVIYLHQYFNTPDMAGGTRSYEFGRRLAAAGHDVQMITGDARRTPGPAITTEAGITVHWLPVTYSHNMPFRKRIRSFADYAFRASRLAPKVGGDVVFATSTPLTVAVPGLLASKRLSVPMVFEVRDLWPHVPIALGAISDPVTTWLTQALERTAYRGSAKIVALSPDNVAAIVAAGAPPQDVVTIPNASDREAFAPNRDSIDIRKRYEWLGSRPLVIYTGTLGNVNEVTYLAKVAAEVETFDPEVRFLILGDGVDGDNVRSVAAELGVLNRNFFMLPRVPKHEVASFLHAADIATSTVANNKALWPNSANKVFDALAAETPIAINHGGWLADLLQESSAGLVLPPDDHPAAAHLLQKHVRDPQWLLQAQTAAAQLARERFDRDLLFDSLHDTLLQAVHPSKG